jgi:hypothetical protein
MREKQMSIEVKYYIKKLNYDKYDIVFVGQVL